MRTVIYGASDDLIEIDGDDLREEFSPADDESATYLAFSNGVMLSILFTDGAWSIRRLAGEDVQMVRSDGSDTGERDEDGCPSYSDKAVIHARVEWAVVGSGMVRKSPAPAVAR